MKEDHEMFSPGQPERVKGITDTGEQASWLIMKRVELRQCW
jgi:hypothetical protein